LPIRFVANAAYAATSSERETKMAERAQVKGTVEYREGDGVNITIRPGPVDVETTPTDATLSWIDGENRGSAAMPINDFRAYVAKGIIVLGR
jgi:hypothetical protein